MPIYEYECKKCGHQTEVMQKFSDPPMAECDMCCGKMRKLISSSTFHLKGSGWYVTDYASKSRSGPGTETKSKSGAENKKETTSKSDTKSPKSETKSSTGGSEKKKNSSNS